MVLDATPGKRVPLGELTTGNAEAPPAWDLAQWNSRFPLRPGPANSVTTNTLAWTNNAKRVAIRGQFPVAGGRPGPPGSPRLAWLGQSEAEDLDLELTVNGTIEYGERARKAGEPWVHLLVEQRFAQPPALGEVETVRFQIEALLTRFFHPLGAANDPRIHAAQFQAFLTIQNRNWSSGGFGKLLWFGVPLFDNRHRWPQPHAARDTAGSGMWIYTPSGRHFTSESLHDRRWVSIDADLLPLIREGLTNAWQHGHLTESKRLADYRITSINLGWELPGVFDVSMRVRGLRLSVKSRD